MRRVFVVSFVVVLIGILTDGLGRLVGTVTQAAIPQVVLAPVRGE
jgi:hypothetical protein